MVIVRTCRFSAPASPPSKLGAENAELDVSQSNSFLRSSSDEFTESYRSIAAQHMSRTSIADQFLAQFESRNRGPALRGQPMTERARDSNNNLTNVSSLIMPDTTKSKQPQQQQASVDEESNATFTVVPSDKTRVYCEKIMMDAARQMTVSSLTSRVLLN